MKILTAPDGTKLQGTLEMVPGIAQIDPDEPVNADGTPNYTGGTEMDWDMSDTVKRDGEPIWVDEDGSEWKRSELVMTEVTDAPE